MDIKYIRDNEIHEKYLFNQLDEKEKQAYEAFLESTPQARLELEQTKKLVTGIRVAGKRNMRKEIEEQVAGLRHRKTDWSILYKAAAVLFIFVLLPAVFYYQHKFADKQEISEQVVSKEYSEPVTTETKAKMSAAGQPAEEEADQSVSQNRVMKVQEEKAGGSAAEKNQTSLKIAEISKSQRAQNKDTENKIVLEKKKTAVEIDNPLARAAAESSIETSDMLDTESLEGEAVVVESNSELDHVLSRVSSSAISKPPKSNLPGAARMETPSGIIGLDYIPAVRSFTFTNNKDSLIVNMKRTHLKESFPNFLKINVMRDSLNTATLDIFVSDQLHSLESNDINVQWGNGNLIKIIFTNKAAYNIKLVNGQKTAVKVE